MTTKTIRTVQCDNRTAIVKFNSEFSEYIVQLSIDGKRVLDADYFTDDRADAINTAELMVTAQYRAIVTAI